MAVTLPAVSKICNERYSAHFTDEDTEDQRGAVSSLGSRKLAGGRGSRRPVSVLRAAQHSWSPCKSLVCLPASIGVAATEQKDKGVGVQPARAPCQPRSIIRRVSLLSRREQDGAVFKLHPQIRGHVTCREGSVFQGRGGGSTGTRVVAAPGVREPAGRSKGKGDCRVIWETRVGVRQEDALAGT